MRNSIFGQAGQHTYLFEEEGSALGLVADVLGVAATQGRQVLHDGIERFFVI